MKIANNVVERILGKPKKGKDTDGDGVIDSKDCQPQNTMRQDYIGTLGPTRIMQMKNKFNRRPMPEKMQQQIQEKKSIEQTAKAKIRSKIY